MKATLFSIMIIFLFNGLPQNNSFRELQGLKGIWVSATKKGNLYESWVSVNEVEMQSKSFMVKERGDTTLLESVRLIETNDGIFYIPVVENQNDRKPVSFKLISSNTKEFTFENKAHDYPQRIIYRFVAPDSLIARIEGEKNGKTMGSNYYFKRAP